MASSTVIISGGAGFIGTRVATALLARGTAVVVLDNLHPQVHPVRQWPAELDGRVVRVPGSVTDIDAWYGAFDAAEDEAATVLHLAAETGTGQSLTQARRHADVNVLGTATLTDALVARGRTPRSIVLTSSRAVYGEGLWRTRDGSSTYAATRLKADLDESEWLPRAGLDFALEPEPNDAERVAARPTNVYASTKLAQEHLLQSWCAAMEVPLSILRLQNVYGAGQSLANSYTGVLTFFATRALAGEPIDVFEGGGIVRDFVHVSDVASAIVTAIGRPGALHAPVDVGSGEMMTLREAATTMAELAGGPAPRITDRYRLGDVRAAFASNRAASERLSYAPRTTFRDGITELLAFAGAG